MESDPPWLTTAFNELELHPAEGNGPSGQNPRITAYLLQVLSAWEISISGDRTPWCSAFVNWCLAQHNMVGSMSALAYSWKHTGGTDPGNSYRRGDILVIDQPPPLPKTGHTGFFLGEAGCDLVNFLAGHLNGTIGIVQWPKKNIVAHRRPATG